MRLGDIQGKSQSYNKKEEGGSARLRLRVGCSHGCTSEIEHASRGQSHSKTRNKGAPSAIQYLKRFGRGKWGEILFLGVLKGPRRCSTAETAVGRTLAYYRHVLNTPSRNTNLRVHDGEKNMPSAEQRRNETGVRGGGAGWRLRPHTRNRTHSLHITSVRASVPQVKSKHELIDCGVHHMVAPP